MMSGALLAQCAICDWSNTGRRTEFGLQPFQPQFTTRLRTQQISMTMISSPRNTCGAISRSNQLHRQGLPNHERDTPFSETLYGINGDQDWNNCLNTQIRSIGYLRWLRNGGFKPNAKNRTMAQEYLKKYYTMGPWGSYSFAELSDAVKSHNRQDYSPSCSILSAAIIAAGCA